jgi:hypothetical protein
MSSTSTPVKSGNPAVVGLFGFGATTLLLQLHNLGLASLGPVVFAGIFLGGLAQLIAGFQEKSMGNNFGYCAFTAYGGFWLALCGILVGNKYGFFASNASDVGWFLTVYTLFTAIMWVGSSRISGAMFACFTTLLIGFVILDLEKFGFGEWLGKYAAIDLIVCALLAWYMMAAVIFQDLFGRSVLPVWAVKK